MSRDFIASCYEVFLGRDLECSRLAADRRHLPRREALASVLGSAEFADRVALPLRRGDPLPECLYRYALTIRHRFWAADELPLLPSSAVLAQEVADWRSFLAVLIADPLLCEVMAVSPLNLGSHGDPAFRALDRQRAACRRPLREVEPASAEFGRMLETYCADVFSDIESVGDNCELGGLQRLAGVETLGLFRWSGVKAEPLIHMLDSDLAGVDDPSHVALHVKVRDDGSAEYMLDHAMFGADAHTFRRPSDAGANEVLAAELNRLKLLKRKFREDVCSGRRIFAYRSDRMVARSEALRLHDAFLRHGPNRLLIVRPADEALAPGEVMLLRANLAVGALDEFALGMEKYSELWPCVLLRARRLLSPIAAVRAAA